MITDLDMLEVHYQPCFGGRLTGFALDGSLEED